MRSERVIARVIAGITGVSGHHAESRNTIIGVLRAPAERANALLKSTWKTLRRVTLGTHRLTAIIAAALVLLHLQRGA